jgi:EAL domain-containing protein (putative c-di-GMP-specific phosphodiesterase class I)
LSELRQAIVQDQLFLEYQPKVNLKDNSFDGVEVLTRWNHPEHGLTSPDQFIPIAERTGLIVPLTLWVLHHAFAQCRSWSDLGFDVGVAVNLSMANLDVLELPAQIDELLKRMNVSADRVELEITESAIMDDPRRAIHILNSIKTLGVRFTIDDFGTGYSSLTHLKKLPVTCIKIDKSFVQNIETDKDNAVIVRAIIDLGHNLGLKVIAEGVETPEAKEMLASFDCDEAQGYLFSYPLPAPEITRLLHRSAITKYSRNPNVEHSTGTLGSLIGHATAVPETNLGSLLICK